MKISVTAVILLMLQITEHSIAEDIQALGCWKDSNRIRALPSLEHTHHFLDGNYKKRSDPIRKCAQVAIDHGYTVFAIQNGGQCFGGSRGVKKYHMYGPSNLCKGGRGGPWSNSVYSTKTSFGRSFRHLMDTSPWDPYCSRDLDILLLLDGSGNPSKKNLERWEEEKEFVLKFMKGFDEKARIGLIMFGSEPQILIDLAQPRKPFDELKERLQKLKFPGGPRSLNDALKRAWREQMKIANRSSADKVIISMTTGDVSYGLYGSSQFLTDHDVRIIALGIDKSVHYEFLQSVASYRDVSNIFSVNSGQLVDVAPYIYRDVCNTMPEYVLATTPVPSKPRTSTVAPNNSTSNDTAKKENNPSNNRHDIPRGMLPVYIPISAYPLLIKGHLLPIPSNSTILNANKKNLVTAIKKGAAKEDVASMVLVNPSPELNLDLTDEEAREISNRDSNDKSLFADKTFENLFPQPADDEDTGNKFYNDSSNNEDNKGVKQEYKKLSGTQIYNKNTANATPTTSSKLSQQGTRNSSAPTGHSFNNHKTTQVADDRSITDGDVDTTNNTLSETQSTEDKLDMEERAPISSPIPKQMNSNAGYENQQPDTATSTPDTISTDTQPYISNVTEKVENFKQKANNIKGKVDQSFNNDTNNKLNMKFSNPNNVLTNTSSQDSELDYLDNSGRQEIRPKDISGQEIRPKDNNENETHPNEETENRIPAATNENHANDNDVKNDDEIHTTENESNESEQKNVTNIPQKALSSKVFEGKGVKGSDSKINGVGAVSQTLELHSGNGKEHVSPHHVNHKSLFSSKLSDRFKMHRLIPMFGERGEIVTSPSINSPNNKTNIGSYSNNSKQNQNTTSFIDNAGKELAEIYKKVHKIEAFNKNDEKTKTVPFSKENEKQSRENQSGEKQSGEKQSGEKPSKPNASVNKLSNDSIKGGRTVEKSVQNQTSSLVFVKSNKSNFTNSENSVFDMDNDDKHSGNNDNEQTIKPTTQKTTSLIKKPTDKNKAFDDLGVDNASGRNPIDSKSNDKHDLKIAKNNTRKKDDFHYHYDPTEESENVIYSPSRTSTPSRKLRTSTNTASSTKRIPTHDNTPTHTTENSHSSTTNAFHSTADMRPSLKISEDILPTHKFMKNITYRSKGDTEQTNSAVFEKNKRKPTQSNITNLTDNNKDEIKSHDKNINKHNRTETNKENNVKLEINKNKNPDQFVKHNMKNQTTIKTIKPTVNNNAELYKKESDIKVKNKSNMGLTSNKPTSPIHSFRQHKNITSEKPIESVKSKSKTIASEKSNEIAEKIIGQFKENKSPIVISDRRKTIGKILSNNTGDTRVNQMKISNKTGDTRSELQEETTDVTDVSPLVTAVADVSNSALEMEDNEPSDQSSDHKIYHFEDLIGGDYNEGFISSPNSYEINELGEKLDKKSLERRKKEVDKLLEILDREDAEKEYYEKSHFYRKDRRPSVETAETRMLKNAFKQINIKPKIEREHHHHHKLYYTNDTNKNNDNYDYDDNNSNDYTDNVDDDNDNDEEENNNTSSDNSINGNINIHGHKVNFISEILTSKDNNNDLLLNHDKTHTEENHLQPFKSRTFDPKDFSHIDANGEHNENDVNDEMLQQRDNPDQSLLRFKPTVLEPDLPPDRNHAYRDVYMERYRKQEKLKMLLKSYENHIIEVAANGNYSYYPTYGKKHNIGVTENGTNGLYNNNKHQKKDKKKKYERILRMISKLVDAIKPVDSFQTYHNNKQIALSFKRKNKDISPVKKHTQINNTIIEDVQSNNKSVGITHPSFNIQSKNDTETEEIASTNKSVSTQQPSSTNKVHHHNETFPNLNNKTYKTMEIENKNCCTKNVVEKNPMSNMMTPHFLPKPLRATYSEHVLGIKQPNQNKLNQPLAPFKPVLGKPKFQKTKGGNPIATYINTPVILPDANTQADNEANKPESKESAEQTPNTLQNNSEMSQKSPESKESAEQTPNTLQNNPETSEKSPDITTAVQLLGSPVLNPRQNEQITMGLPTYMTEKPPDGSTSLVGQLQQQPQFKPVVGDDVYPLLRNAEPENNIDTEQENDDQNLNSDEIDNTDDDNDGDDGVDDFTPETSLRHSLHHVFGLGGKKHNIAKKKNKQEKAQRKDNVQRFTDQNKQYRDQLKNQLMFDLSPLNSKQAPSYNNINSQLNLNDQANIYQYPYEHPFYNAIVQNQQMQPTDFSLYPNDQSLPVGHPSIDPPLNAFEKPLPAFEKPHPNPAATHIDFHDSQPELSTPLETHLPPQQGKKYDYLNLNTLTRRKNSHKRMKSPRLPQPPSITTSTDFTPLSPAGHIRPLVHTPPRPLLKPHHPTGFKSLFEHVKKTNMDLPQAKSIVVPNVQSIRPAGQIKPMLNSPPRPLLKPHHPDGFKSLFEHVKKEVTTVGKPLFHIKNYTIENVQQNNGTKKTITHTEIINEAKGPHLYDESFFKTKQWASEEISGETLLSRSMKGKEKQNLPFTEEDFTPKIPPALFKTNHKTNLKNIQNVTEKDLVESNSTEAVSSSSLFATNASLANLQNNQNTSVENSSALFHKNETESNQKTADNANNIHNMTDAVRQTSQKTRHHHKKKHHRAHKKRHRRHKKRHHKHHNHSLFSIELDPIDVMTKTGKLRQIPLSLNAYENDDIKSLRDDKKTIISRMHHGINRPITEFDLPTESRNGKRKRITISVMADEDSNSLNGDILSSEPDSETDNLAVTSNNTNATISKHDEFPKRNKTHMKSFTLTYKDKITDVDLMDLASNKTLNNTTTGNETTMNLTSPHVDTKNITSSNMTSPSNTSISSFLNNTKLISEDDTPALDISKNDSALNQVKNNTEKNDTILSGNSETKKKTIVMKTGEFKESDFPKTVPISSFKLSNLPVLSHGKSYILSTPNVGFVSIKVKEDTNENPDKRTYFRTVEELSDSELSKAKFNSEKEKEVASFVQKTLRGDTNPNQHEQKKHGKNFFKKYPSLLTFANKNKNKINSHIKTFDDNSRVSKSDDNSDDFDDAALLPENDDKNIAETQVNDNAEKHDLLANKTLETINTTTVQATNKNETNKKLKLSVAVIKNNNTLQNYTINDAESEGLIDIVHSAIKESAEESKQFLKQKTSEENGLTKSKQGLANENAEQDLSNLYKKIHTDDNGKNNKSSDDIMVYDENDTIALNNKNETSKNKTNDFYFQRVPKLMKGDVDTSLLQLPTKNDYKQSDHDYQFTHMLPNNYTLANLTPNKNKHGSRNISAFNANVTELKFEQINKGNNTKLNNYLSMISGQTDDDKLCGSKRNTECKNNSKASTKTSESANLYSALSELNGSKIEGSNITIDNSEFNGNASFDKISPLEYMLGCNKPLRVLYAIDVSDGLGAGPLRSKRWHRLKDFIENINKDVINNVRHHYMVYNVEPRFLKELSGCDKDTEYFMTADDCLCGNSPRNDNVGCSVNAPNQDEALEDWGTLGPRTGHALNRARKQFFSNDLNQFKNVIFLVSHKESADELQNAENNLKKEGISLIDIELGDRHDLRRRSHINRRRHNKRHFIHHVEHKLYDDARFKRSSNDGNIPDDHKMKVSLKKLQSTLRNIIGKVCKANTDDETKKSFVSKHI